MPYKRYDSSCIEQAVTEPKASVTVCAESSTLLRWKQWFRVLAIYWTLVLNALSLRYPSAFSATTEASLVLPSSKALAFLEQDPGWLARIVRPVANAHLWVHTRFAYLSTPELW